MNHRYETSKYCAFSLIAILTVMVWCSTTTRAGTACRDLGLKLTNVAFTEFLSVEAATTGDFTGDGNTDLATLSPYGQVYIRIGDGLGQMYSTFALYPFGQNVHGLASADFNGDGKLDLATAGAVDGTIFISFGDGAGGLAPATSYVVPVTPHESGVAGPYAIGGVSDLNGDGRADLVIVKKESNFIQILFNRGNGNMTFSRRFAVGLSPRGVATGDFNADGKRDLAVANHDSDNVSVLLGIDGLGSYSEATNYPVGTSPFAIVANDFNGDGKSDLALARTDKVSVLLSTGNGFSTQTDFAAPSADTGIDCSCTLAAGDFNGDGKIDIATVKEPVFSVLIGTGTGNFISPATFAHASLGIIAADLNDDGRSDVVTLGFGIILNLVSDCPISKPKVDYDGDNKTDIAVWRPSEGNWYIMNSADYTLRVDQWGLGSLGDKPVPGDYDGDGRSDLAVFRPSTGTWYIRQSSDNSVRAQPFGLATDKLVPGDYDGDRITDLAVWRPDEGSWYILQSSDGGLRVEQWGHGALGDVPVQADYDGDGRTDLTVFRTGSRTWYSLNSANGALTSAQFGAAGDVPIPGYFSGEGKADFTVWRPSTNFWYAYPNQTIAVAANGDVLVPGDYDGDNIEDAAFWESTTGVWSIRRTSFRHEQPLFLQPFGMAGDVPVSTPYLLAP